MNQEKRIMDRESKKQIIKTTLSVILFAVGLLILAYSIYNIGAVKARCPWLDNQYQAWKYDRLAKSFAAGDYRSVRYRAIADALRKGDHDYKFQTGPLPPMK
jgi:hypothetical protein